MPKLIFVIGANATGKTHFIRQRFSGKGMTCFNIYDYQQRVYREEGVGEFVPMGAQFRYLMRANQMLLADVKEALTRDEDVVVEHTLYMAKRRIAYIDVLRKEVRDLTIDVYVMCPSDAQWEANAVSRGAADHFQRFKSEADILEFPNSSEGIDAIYEVMDGEIKLRIDPPRPEIYESAKRALAEETARLQSEDETREKGGCWLTACGSARSGTTVRCAGKRSLSQRGMRAIPVGIILLIWGTLDCSAPVPAGSAS